MAKWSNLNFLANITCRELSSLRGLHCWEWFSNLAFSSYGPQLRRRRDEVECRCFDFGLLGDEEYCTSLSSSEEETDCSPPLVLREYRRDSRTSWTSRRPLALIRSLSRVERLELGNIDLTPNVM